MQDIPIEIKVWLIIFLNVIDRLKIVILF